MIPDNIIHPGLHHISPDIRQVEKSLIPFRVHGILGHGKHLMKFHGNQGGIFHHIFADPGWTPRPWITTLPEAR